MPDITQIMNQVQEFFKTLPDRIKKIPGWLKTLPDKIKALPDKIKKFIEYLKTAPRDEQAAWGSVGLGSLMFLTGFILVIIA